MRISLIISFSLHFAVVAAAFVVLPEAERFKVKITETIPVEILTISEFSKLAAKPEDEKKEEPKPPELEPEPEPAPKPPELTPKPPEPEPEPEPKPPEPEPEPKPPEPEPEPEPKRLLKSVPLPRARPKFAQIKPKNESKFNSQKIAALLNKLPEDKAKKTTNPKKKTKSRFSGRDATISASEEALLKRRIGECWNTPVGVENAEKLIVTIKIYLNRDGALDRAPEVLQSASDIAADSALRAITRCQPYDMLSLKKYNTWREIVLNFDPREMFGG